MKKKVAIKLYFVFYIGSSILCSAQNFGARIDKGIIDNASLKEASGIASSRRNPAILWSHNDSGDKSRLFALTTSAKLAGIYNIKNAENRDWEDICTGIIDNAPYIFVGDIGDNDAKYDIKTIYKIPEPWIDENQNFINDEIKGAEKIRFRYPDGQRDAETLMFDNKTSDLFVVSKREDSVHVYRLEYPQSTTEIIIPEHVATLPYKMVVSGDISPNGSEILLKNYQTVYYFQRADGESVAEALLKTPKIISQYITEPQGEGICFDASGEGFYTISEESPLKLPVHLYYYPRQSNRVQEMNGAGESAGNSIDTVIPSHIDGSLAVKFTLAAPATAEFFLYDLSGKFSPLIAYQNMTAGKHEAIIPAPELAGGTYRLMLRTGTDNETSFVFNTWR